MSRLLIQKYFNELASLKKFSGSLTEGVISEAFKDLLKDWSRQNNLHFISQYEFVSPQKNRIRPDGTILHDLRVPLGYWEAKDTADDLDEEIRKKLAKGYPQDNIIFENSDTAVLIQNRQEVLRCSMTDEAALQKLVTLFFSYEREEIRDFRAAVQQFKTDLPAVLEALRARIDDAYKKNAAFGRIAADFLKHAKETINPAIGEADVREMLIQHILTEEIFAKVFDSGDFHRENNIAKELYALEDKFFTGQVKRETLKGLEPYYATIRANAALITSHAEKQTFLKVIYENFYKVYNPKAADRLGVVYTPNEIVKFMIEGADWLTQKHFGKSLIDRDVEILDPATGTGTFICELLEHFRGQPKKLAHKYKNELHANEVAILPYYVANLNIEATYAAISGQFAEFPNLCFVDTLDNVTGLGIRTGQHVGDLFGALSEENVERVRRQNKRKISVIIGNPPYNANQANENDNNKNREYPHIDKLIKDTYIKLSIAQKTKVYDMYARFFRWASDRLHDDGVLAFITNRSFIETRTFDGFRKSVTQDFNEIFVVDLGGDVRANPKLSGTKHNVFGIQTGVAISFLVKRRKQKGCKIFYARRPEMDTAEEKLTFLSSTQASAIPFEQIEPDKNGNWIRQAENDWDGLLPIVDKKTKSSKSKSKERAIFKLYSLGVSTNRDEWLYGHSRDQVEAKAKLLSLRYNDGSPDSQEERTRLKWSETLTRRKNSGSVEHFDKQRIIEANYRPFFRLYVYRSDLYIDRPGLSNLFFPDKDSHNLAICFNDTGARTHPCLLATNGPADLHFGAAIDAYQQAPLFSYSSGERIDNVTDWALKQFQKAYPKDGKTAKAKPITKDAIFHYVYAVLHDPVYRETYALNLKREFPRIPFYPDFWRWAVWGETLMALHIAYEKVEPWPLTRIDTPDERARAAGVAPKAMLRADRENGAIQLDTETRLSGIPPEAWTYRLGNRSGIDWILEQYREKTPKDPTIREKFNTYRFADYKEKVIDLIARVTRVSVETVKIIEAMRAEKR
ncbi:MAG: DNA methyltransferase [Bradyrhizobiaceae bacterium]|nr:MAG: DNA methyltransferase [Bradyrhizobiaceae bacterium]